VLSAEQRPDGIILITAIAVDRNGQRCLDYNKRIYFANNGPGRLLVDYGTPTRSSVIEMANGKAQIEFEPALDVQATIEARTQDIQGTFVTVSNGSR
jgi:beta-galactosidase